MGWTTCFNATFYKTVKVKGRWGSRSYRVVDRQKEIDKMLTWKAALADGGEVNHRVLKSAMVGSVYYAAVTSERPGMPTKVWAAVFLTCGKGSDGTEWGYKDMDEDCGPNESKCPPSILKLLTPTEHEWALEWRKRCEEYNAEKKRKPVEIAGVELKYRGGWTVTSAAYRSAEPYYCVRYRLMSRDNALRAFLKEYGTDEERAEYERQTGKKVETREKEVQKTA